MSQAGNPFGDGTASKKIVQTLERLLAPEVFTAASEVSAAVPA
jgi:UDP-N-acetylglucosamine 2-epimerase